MDDDRPMRSLARLLAIALEGGAARDDEDAVKRAYQKVITLRSMGVELVSSEDLATALDGIENERGQPASVVMQRLAQRF